MRLIYAFLFLLGAFMARGHPGYFILTKFEGVERYTNIIARESSCLPKATIRGESGFQLCTKLLAAPLVQVITGSIPQNITTPNNLEYHQIDAENWDLLKYNYSLEKPVQRCGVIGDKIYVIWTRLCISHDPHTIWMVALDKPNYIGLLFEHNSRGTKFFAIIDYSRRLNPFYDRRSFHDIAVLTSLEVLCNLKKQSQSRLCAMSADGLHRSKNIYRGSNFYYRKQGDEYEFKDPNMNFIYSNTLGICPNITVETDFSEELYFTSGLQCYVLFQNYTYHFYIKRNLEKTGLNSSVFVIEEALPNSNILRGEIVIRQLDEIFLVDQYILDDIPSID